MLCLTPFRDEEHAVELANATEFGLSGYVQSADVERARRVAGRLRTGMVHLNGAPTDGRAPFGGYKQSGNGREWGRFGLEDFLEVKAVMGWGPRSALSRPAAAPERPAAQARRTGGSRGERPPQPRSASTRSTSSRVVSGLTKQKRRTVSPWCLVGITMARPRASASAHQAA